MMSLWDALRMNMMISYQELVRTFPKEHRLILINRKLVKELYFYRDELLFLSIGYTSFSSHPEKIDHERRRLAGRYSEK
ncbi:hypothetical protein AN966_09500 [Klebsiella pneumoniae]|nr:hypothetical protein AN966_09500 [Klebsiella pneumoniae]NJC90552.1 hypothetical protein [Klebsiella pneumoniae]NJD12518.1 hypothetical protein [Klebsiella pneumoniae]NJD40063.1 hypothetical protein [Klebsiella pneumoniae]NJD48162.1 hypothetical protein [Klebsiella pneumoniae]